MLTRWLYMLGGAVLVTGLAFGSGYLKGRSDGRVEQLKDTVAAFEKRERIDSDVSGFDRVRLCVELGGLPDECEQLRGLEADPSEDGERRLPGG